MTTGATNGIHRNRPAIVGQINAPRSAAGLTNVAPQHELSRLAHDSDQLRGEWLS